MAEIMNLPLSWIVLFFSSVFCVILIVFICVCWQGRKKKSQSYVMDSGDLTQSELATNSIPHITAENKQKYFLHGIAYSSINNSDDTSGETSNEHFAYNILSIFKNIQKSKFANSSSDMAKILTDNLEDSHTDTMHKNFDKSVLCLEWNENGDNNVSRTNDKDEIYSCISTESKETYTSAVPFYNRSQSVAETFKSINSEN